MPESQNESCVNFLFGLEWECILVQRKWVFQLLVWICSLEGTENITPNTSKQAPSAPRADSRYSISTLWKVG